MQRKATTIDMDRSRDEPPTSTAHAVECPTTPVVPAVIVPEKRRVLFGWNIGLISQDAE